MEDDSVEDEYAQELAWDDDIAEESIAQDQQEQQEDDDDQAEAAEDRSDYDAEWLDDEDYEYVEEEPTDSAPSLIDRIKSFFRGLSSSYDQEDDFEGDYEEYGVEEEYVEDAADDANVSYEDDSVAAAYEARHYGRASEPLDEPEPMDEYEPESFVEDDLYVDEGIEEEAYYIEDEFDEYEEVLEEVPDDEARSEEHTSELQSRI